MADNYLELRMDDYRTGRLAMPRRRKVYPETSPDAIKSLEGSRVFVKTPSASSSERAKSLIAILVSTGCKVAFTDTDSKGGTALAQSTGTQCHPIDIADEVAVARSEAIITDRWGGIDITVELP